ncbi:hypothetical protein F5876DRAFT_83821 [Lentinula aff. lateritia]|uniref:Uncharacterized protein n=1 Tax=Lentinula aff. lateritia TaxID=2804960 RepID=A0ACC1TI27_9AGAR|nr:hypothetical protein F5876DRAFT_83821 [Lentinula aff. lateritia]
MNDMILIHLISTPDSILSTATTSSVSSEPDTAVSVKRKTVAMGRPPNMDIKQLIERVKKTTKTAKPGWTCIATKCTHQESGNNDSTRIKKHASSCLILAEEYPDKYQWARSGMAKDSIGTKLLQVSEGVTSDTEENEPKQAKQTTLDINVFKEKGRQKDKSMRADMQLRVDHLIIHLICARGLVPEILDSQEWHNLLKTK